MSDRVDINRLLVEMRSLKAQTQVFNKPQGLAAKDIAPGAVHPGQSVGKSEAPSSFGNLMQKAIDKVNETQQDSATKAQAYTQGNPNVDITDVMIASQKAEVSFQAMVQVRNKLIEAYREVMNMPL